MAYIKIFIGNTSAASGQTIAAAQASETDTAQAVAWAPRNRFVTQTTETDLAQAITRVKRVTIVQVTETNLAQAINEAKQRTLTQTTEADLVQAINPSESHPAGQASETDAAQAIAPRKTRTLVQGIEADSAQAIGSAKYGAVVQVTETDLAQLFGKRKIKVFGQVSETDAAIGLVGAPQTIPVGQAVEIDLVLTIQPPGVPPVVSGQNWAGGNGSVSSMDHIFWDQRKKKPVDLDAVRMQREEEEIIIL